jgi:hypothetical protein
MIRHFSQQHCYYQLASTRRRYTTIAISRTQATSTTAGNNTEHNAFAPAERV